MKEYPSIINSSFGRYYHKTIEIPDCFVFDKLDGSSMRSEWNSKRGWYKHGKRHGLCGEDCDNPHLAVVPKLFEETLAEPLEKIARESRWKNLVVFYEFWGKKSLAGSHEERDLPKYLSVFDATVDKKGFLSPKEFVQTFEGKVLTAAYLGTFNWSRDFVEKVYNGELEGVTFEGVVGKAGTKHEIVRAKAKTKAWIDKVKEIHQNRWYFIVDS